METAPALADPVPLALHVVTASGGAVALEPTPGADESVAGLRRRVALALGRHHCQVRLLHGQAVLADGDLLSEAVGSAGDATITAVVVQPALEELKSHVEVVDASGRIGGRFQHHKHLRRVTEGLEFPAPQDICINMLPFVMGDPTSLPEEYQHYWPMIKACKLPQEELGRVGYLTVHESLVPAGESQRRRGLHIEIPGLVMMQGKCYGRFASPMAKGGLYMASSVQDSCRVWQASITDPALVAGPYGDLEHVRQLLGQGHLMAANVMYWLTDRTPQEPLPAQEETYHQFFRLVTSQLCAWFRERSTANRCGTQPDPATTKIVEGGQFDA